MKRKNSTSKHLWSKGQDNGMLPDGRYIYVPAHGQPIFLTPGQDGVTEEDILILSGLDHEQAKRLDYERKKRDFACEAAKEEVSDSNTDAHIDPIENMADPKADIFSLLFPEKEQEDPRLALLHDFIDRLQPQQIDLLYSLYGELKQMTEIAEQEGVTKYAIYNRQQKILTRLKKMFAEAGFSSEKP